jgi:hypothetical protein
MSADGEWIAYLSDPFTEVDVGLLSHVVSFLSVPRRWVARLKAGACSNGAGPHIGQTALRPAYVRADLPACLAELRTDVSTTSERAKKMASYHSDHPSLHHISCADSTPV